MVGHIILNELKIWRSIVFKHLFVGRLKGSSRNDGRLCIHGGVKELLCTPRTIMVEFAILALAVGKRTEPLIRVCYIYLRKHVELWWRVADVDHDLGCTSENALRHALVLSMIYA